VVGVMGVLQALEAVRMVTGGKLELSTTPVEGEPVPKNEASMLLFSANSSPPFRTLRLRSRRPQCFACSSSSDLTLQSLSSGSLDYVLFCGMTTPVRVLEPEERISALDYSVLLKSGKKHILVDVREKVQFDICSLDGSINIPFSTIQGSKPLDEQSEWLNGEMDIYVVCRLGNDSQIIARKLKDDGFAEGRYIGDIKGGLKAWKNEVDENWPEY
jgi:adenylyltransferase/sulfurtransferase